MKNNIFNESKSDPIFIIGMNGSGTTLLLDLLNNHSNIFGFNFETKILPYYYLYIKKNFSSNNDSKLHFKLFKKISKEFVFKSANNGNKIPFPKNFKRNPLSLPEIFDYIFMYFALKNGKKRWCEKTPYHAKHLEILNKMFPRSKFIHIIRDGRSCAASMHRRWKYHPEISIYRWKKLIKEARYQSKLINPLNYIEIKYEDLTSNPEELMRKICRFINEPFENNVLHCSRIRTFTGSQANTIVNNQRKWEQYFNLNQQNRLEVIAGHMLTTFGYSSNYPTSDEDPSRLIMGIWFYYGHISHFLNDCFKNMQNRKFITKLRKKLPLFINKIRNLKTI